MPLIDIFKRASRLVLNLQNSNTTTSYEEGEIVFCKNNVCVHPPTILRQETEIIHHPGYLTISCQRTNNYCDPSKNGDTSLILTWIPNSTLRKCPSSVEKLSANKSQDRSNRFKISPKIDPCSPNGRRSLHSITSVDSQESALSTSQCSDLKDPTKSEDCISLAEPVPKTSLPDICDQSSVGTVEIIHPISDNYSLQVEMLDNDDVCRITMEKTNFKDNSDTSSTIVDKNVSKSNFVLNNNEASFSGNLSCDHKSGSDVSPSTNSQNTSKFINENVKCNLPCANQSDENETFFNSKDNQNKFDSIECQRNQSQGIPTSCSQNSPEEVTIHSQPDVQTNLHISEDVILKKSTSEIVSESTKEELTHDIPNLYETRNRFDSAENNYKASSESFSGNCEATLKELTDVESLEGTQHKDHSASVPTSKRSSLSEDSENVLESPDQSIKEESNFKNSPSKHVSLSNSVSSDFTYPTSIDSINDSLEKETGAPKSPSDCSDSNSCDSSVPMWTYSSEYLNRRRYLPESNSASPATIRQIQRSCQKFSVDLGEMRSLRLFFSNGDTSSGQLVIASRESQYKILHFHHGGLDKLGKILHEWNRLTNFDPSNKNNVEDIPYRHFMICRPEVNENDLHPEEGKVPMLTEELWWNLLNELGQIEDPLFLRKSAFFNGLPPQLRRTVWPFLLQIYSYQSTFTDRETISKIRKLEYQEIIRRRLKLTGVNKENFTRNVQYVIEKDVVRTDRNNPFYAGDTNPNLETMKNILLNYAVYDSSLGYLQGMSDLLAPLLAEIRDESESFWCFCGLMQRRLFVCTPTDADMEKNLRYLRELIRIMVPTFYSHLLKHQDAMELLFCHRWILLCFKREFPEKIVFQIWEACWSNYLIDYFHLFVCLAIVAAYSPDVIAQDLRTDEMLLHFSSLSMYMDGVLILKKARWLLYKFRQLLVIPCSLAMLCEFSGPGMWDNTHTPSVKCLDDPKYCPDTPCPYRGSIATDS